ncbi:MAG: hypothetical protein AB3N10_18950 [Allomuricauda sp.]
MRRKSELSLLLFTALFALPVVLGACNDEGVDQTLVETKMVAELPGTERSAGYACCPDESGFGCFDLGFTPVPKPDGSYEDVCPYGWILYECDAFTSYPDGTVECL